MPDWGWLLGIGVLKPFLVADQLGLPLRRQAEALQDELATLGPTGLDQNFHLPWGLIRLVLHRGDPDLHAITADDVDELRHAIRTLDRIPTIDQVIDTGRLRTIKANWGTAAFRVGTALFHVGITDRPPARMEPKAPPALSSKPRINAVPGRYVAERALTLRPESMSSERGSLRRFGLWLDTERPHIDRLDQLQRTDLVAFLESVKRLQKSTTPTNRSAPPTRPASSPSSPCSSGTPRWPSGTTCPPGRCSPTPTCPAASRRSPASSRTTSSNRSWARSGRWPAHCNAAPCSSPAGGAPAAPKSASFTSTASTPTPTEHPPSASPPARASENDTDMGRPVRYLFLRNGRLAHPDYLFAASLRQVCETLGSLSVAGKPAIHAHRFRHTLGTQLAEKGARTQTIMKILGHKSPGMSMTYAHISDPTVLADYQAVLQPGAIIAGPIAETLRAGRLDQDALDWLRTNFYKTELELGRCLRLPPEGHCECDLYLNCARFVTTPQYAPRLRVRLCVERLLFGDAKARGWEREVDRHQLTTSRIVALLDELGEAPDSNDAGGGP
jgi:Phage integrase family